MMALTSDERKTAMKSWDMEIDNHDDNEYTMTTFVQEKRATLKSKLHECRDCLTVSEKKFLENLVQNGSDNVISQAIEKLNDKKCFDGVSAIDTDFANKVENHQPSSLGVEELQGRPGLVKNHGSVKRIELLRERSRSMVHEKMWRAHENGLRISDTSSRHSLNLRDLRFSDSFRKSSIRRKSMMDNGDEIFRPDAPSNSGNESDSGMRNSLLSIPPIGLAHRLRSESTISIRSDSNEMDQNSFIPLADQLKQLYPPKTDIRKKDNSKNISTEATSNEKNTNRPPLPHLPFVRTRSTSSQNFGERQQKRSLHRRVLVRESSVGNGIEISLDAGSDKLLSKPPIVQRRSSSINSRSSSINSNSGKIPLLRRSSSSKKLTRSSSVSSINSSYLPSSYDDHDLLARSFVLDASMRQNSSHVLSNLLLQDKEASLSDTEVRPGLLADENRSWDEEDMRMDKSFDAWNILKDDYALEYGGGDSLPFFILGTNADDLAAKPHVLSPPLMESLQNFLPLRISEDNFWLKYSLIRDGASLQSLLQYVRGSRNTIIAIESVDGDVFGSYTSSSWKKSTEYYGSGESFLWRMRKPRSTACHSIIDQAHLESELDVFPWTGNNDMVQLVKSGNLILGGGEIDIEVLPPSPKGWSIAARNLGFGLSLDSDLLNGSSSPCDTFGNPSLAQNSEDGIFEIANLEVWTLTPSNNEENAEKIEHSAFFLEANLQQ